MLKFYFISLFTLYLTMNSSLSAHENNTAKEIALVDDLIGSAQSTLSNLTYLKEMLSKYQTLQDNYMKDSSDTEALYQMIRLAHEILGNIKTSQMTTLFEPSFLSELSIISKPATKLGIPKP